MNLLSTPRLVLKRLADDRMLLLSIFVGITIATTLMATAPVYLKALERLALNQAIDRLTARVSSVNVFAFNVPLTTDGLANTEHSIGNALDRHVSPIYKSRERYLIVDTYLAGLPANPLPESEASNVLVDRANLRYFSNLEHHVRFLDGRMASGVMERSELGPTLEVVISPATAEEFQVWVGDVITLIPDLGRANKISTRIAGIVEATNPTEAYWSLHASFFLDPPPPEEGITIGDVGDLATQVYDPERPPVPLFTTQGALVEAIGQAYPGTLVDSVWFIQVDPERLKEWSTIEALQHLTALEGEVTKAMPGSEVSTGIVKLMNDFESRVFFTRVPLLVLLVIMETTVLFFLFMMVYYLVQSREKDAALLRTRGVGTLQLLRLYALEGLAMTAVAVALAPFLAMGIVALAGKLSYFRDMTGGALLPVELGPGPFLGAGGAGLLSLVIFVIPGVVGARSGVLVHKLRTSRPPTMSFFHRYYLDVALLSLGGLTFWEMHSRGHLISGGLFKDVEVNETLLLTPVLFLIVVALVFMRFFPLVVRFISGESPALVHLLAAATLLFLAPAIAMRDIRDGGDAAWLGPVALLAAIGGVYWATSRAERRRSRMAGLVLQAGLVGWFLTLKPPETGDLLFPPTVALISIVPVQVAFLFLKASTRAMPAWLSMGLWRMARNPLQYTWLVLLLVLASGLGILSTTVGGTLERSQEDRVMYDVAADIRLTQLRSYSIGGAQAIRDRYLSLPGVTGVSLALRETGSIGPTSVEVLALESWEFPYISWYREDFSDSSLDAVMMALRSHAPAERIAIPDGATSIGLWTRAEEVNPNLSIWLVVEDDRGAVTPISLGKVRTPEWHLMSTDLPSRLRFPLYLVSVQVFEPGQEASQTAGTLLIDDIHVAMDHGNEEQVLEDFESRMMWIPIVTSALSLDRILSTEQEVYRGNKAGLFSFGSDTDLGTRGFYQSPTGGPVPIVVSSSLTAAADMSVGEAFIAVIAGRRIPVVIRDMVTHFPTMNSDGGSFLLADLDGLLAHLNILRPVSEVRPNELFLTESPDAHQTVRDAVSSMGQLVGQVHDRAARLESIRTDPLTSAGWRSMVLFSLAVVVLAAVLGYATHLLSFASRTRSEMGFLQSLGTSRRQLMALLGFEHLAIAVIGLGLGTWAGFQMSDLMVTSLAVTETGDQVMPPVVLITDWRLMLPTYAVLVGIFSAALLILNRSIHRLDLQSISRTDGF